MADKIKFWYGSTSDINTPSSSNYPAVVRGLVYFAVDLLTTDAENGQIYFDVPIGTGTQAKRIIIGNQAAFATSASTALYASTAAIAQKDERNLSITEYIKGLTLSGHTLILTKGSGAESTLTLPDDDYKLKVTSTGSVGSKIYLLGNTSTSLGTPGNSVTSTGITFKDIYIGTDGFLQGKIKTNGILTFGDGKIFNGSSNITVGDTIHYIPGTGTATTTINYSLSTSTATGVYSTRWGGIVDDSITSLYSGLTIAYKIPVNGNNSYNNVLKLTKADGTIITNSNNASVNNGYYPVVYNDSNWITTRYPVGSILLLVFDADKVITDHRPVNDNTMSITGCWKLVDYDSTNIYLLKKGYNGFLTSTTTYRYQFMLQTDEDKVTPVNTVDNNTTVNKTLTTELFNPFGLIYYYNSTTTKNANTAIGDTFYELILADLRYSFNTGTTLIANKAVYLVTSLPNANGKVSLDPTSPIVLNLPVTNTNKLYIYLGQAYDTYRIELLPIHPVYIYQNGALRFYSGYTDYAKIANQAIYDGSNTTTPIADKYIANVSSLILSNKPTLVFSNGNGTEPDAWKFPYVPLGSDGKIDLTYIPQTAIERLHVVASTAAMVALTTATVLNGDVVKVTDKNTMYFVSDDTKLNTLAGYTEFAVGTAGSIAWSNITGKPALLTTASKATLSTSTTNATIKISWIDYGGNESPDTHLPDLIIPAATTSVAGLVTTGEQTFAGNKIFSTATINNKLNYSGILSVSDNADYYLWMATAATATKGTPVYSTALSYNPSSKTLNAIANQAKYDSITTTATIAQRYVEYDRTSFTSSANRIVVTSGSGAEKVFDINNYYPSTLTWATTASTVIGTLKNRSHTSTALVNAVTFPTIPVASTTDAGIITASAQTIGGVKTFKDGAVFSSKVTFNGSADSTHSLDANASIVTQGGISVAKLLSAKQIRIDDNTSDKSVTLLFDAGREVLSFIFE